MLNSKEILMFCCKTWCHQTLSSHAEPCAQWCGHQQKHCLYEECWYYWLANKSLRFVVAQLSQYASFRINCVVKKGQNEKNTDCLGPRTAHKVHSFSLKALEKLNTAKPSLPTLASRHIIWPAGWVGVAPLLPGGWCFFVRSTRDQAVSLYNR